MEKERQRISLLKHQRKFMRGEITKIKNSVHTEIDVLTLDSKYEFKQRLHKLRTDIEPIDKEIFSLLYSIGSDDTVSQSEYDEVARYHSSIDVTLSKLCSVSENVDASSKCNSHSLRLPTVPLPEFSNSEGESLGKFLVNFENIVHKFKIRTFEKFCLLPGSLWKQVIRTIKVQKSC